VIDTKARYWSKIGIFYPVGGPVEYCHKVWYEKKLEWCGYPVVKKTLKICLFDLTEYTNVTDRQTPDDGIGHT